MRDPGTRWRSLLYQALVLAALLALLFWLAHNTREQMQARSIHSGFDFLLDRAGFDIGESLIPYNADAAYWRAFAVGLGNTVCVALPGVLLATLLGTAIGLGRLARNVLLRALCGVYVELLRNIPLLLQLLFWYLLSTRILPDVAAPVQLGPLELSKAGLSFIQTPGATAADAVDRAGGFAPSLSPEYLALLFGLVTYTASYIAEVVRAGIASVPAGQREAAQALGLGARQVLRLVTLPQALRLIVPPLTNQYLNLIKNSSLAVAIGYPDLVSISNTALNQSGRALECMAVIVAVYLSLSLLTALTMGLANRRAALRAR